MRNLVYGLLPAVCIAHFSFGQQLVITSEGSYEFTFGIDSVLYTQTWQRAASTPIRKEQNTFFVLLKGDSTLLQKKLPKSADVHHYVIDRSNTGKMTLFYRGILAGVPDSVAVLKDKTKVRLSDFFNSRRQFEENALVADMPANTQPTGLPADTSNTLAPISEKPFIPEQAPVVISGENTSSSDEAFHLPFDQIVRKVTIAEFEFEKMMMIKEHIEKNQTTTQELKILARLLTYDLTRLQLLKESYEYTKDRINYPELVSVFDFEFTKQSFLQFLNEHEK